MLCYVMLCYVRPIHNKMKWRSIIIITVSYFRWVFGLFRSYLCIDNGRFRSHRWVSRTINFPLTFWCYLDLFQFKDNLSKCKGSHYKDKTVVMPFYLYKRNSYSDKMTYWYWESPRYKILVPTGNIRFNSLRPRPNRRHFADDIFKCIFENEDEWISPKISLKFVPRVRINNITALVQIMAWRRTGDKPLSEPMMTQFNDAYMRHSASMN